jgi:Zn-dependent peptidase ImmA (M78 family)
MDEPLTIRLPDPVLEAEEIFGKVESHGPTADLTRIVSLWPDLSVVEEDLDGAGYLVPIGEIGGTILVNRADTEERKRFTIAHELGHWVLGLAVKKVTGRFSQPKDMPYASIERWCDQFATNLLMPEAAIRASITRNDQSLVLESVARAASRFKVSEQAFYIRMWEVLRFQVAIVTLSGAHGTHEARLEKTFGDEQANKALENALCKAEIVNQLVVSPMVRLSLSSSNGKVKCIGRRLGAGRLLLLLMWPVEDLAKGQVGKTQTKASQG